MTDTLHSCSLASCPFCYISLACKTTREPKAYPGCMAYLSICRQLILFCLRERAEAAAIKRETRPSALQTASPVSEGSMAGPWALVPQPSSLGLAAGIDELVAALKPCRSTGGVAGEDSLLSTSGAALWPPTNYVKQQFTLTLLSLGPPFLCLLPSRPSCSYLQKLPLLQVVTVTFHTGNV